jgi:hypothetical protein
MNPDEVTSHHYEYLGNGRVLASLTTESGTVRFVMTAVMFLEAMRLANECMNANLRPVLRDIGVF